MVLWLKSYYFLSFQFFGIGFLKKTLNKIPKKKKMFWNQFKNPEDQEIWLKCEINIICFLNNCFKKDEKWYWIAGISDQFFWQLFFTYVKLNQLDVLECLL